MMGHTSRSSSFAWLMMLSMSLVGYCQAPSGGHSPNDIRKLSQHFTDANGTSPWMFVPQDNIKSLSLTEHPGYVTIWEAGKGQDVKGILKDPIKIDDYPLPWEFNLGLGQYKSSSEPGTYAIGLNLAVTFSDPSTWPADRMQMPPDTHLLQLFVVHLKAQGDLGGANAASFKKSQLGFLNYGDPSAETYLVYGKGDLDPSITGDWRVPYVWLGFPGAAQDWSHSGGPASFELNYRVKLVSPTHLEVGFFGGEQGEPHTGWRMRKIDVSHFGRITGIWQIGPIISLDRWIPDVLVPGLNLSPSPLIAPVESAKEFYLVDYAVFYGVGPQTVEDMSDDFDHPGFQPKWYHEGDAIVETYSHPGYLTVTLPPSLMGWAMCPTSIGRTNIDFNELTPFPGYEVEISFVPPEGKTTMWNLYMSSFSVWDQAGKPVGSGSMTQVFGSLACNISQRKEESRS